MPNYPKDDGVANFALSLIVLITVVFLYGTLPARAKAADQVCIMLPEKKPYDERNPENYA